MANHVVNSLEYWISIPLSEKSALYPLRKWSHLKVAFDDDYSWIRGCSLTEIESPEVLQIPFIKRYYSNNAHLVPFGKSLPELVEPSLLWTPIQRGLQISLPKENFNFFGLEQTFKINLVKSKEPKSVDVTIVDISLLENYINNAFDVRLKHLTWTVFVPKNALIIGSPMLPIQGNDYYINDGFIIPAGWQLEYDHMVPIYKEALGESFDFWYLLNEVGELSKIKKFDFNRLSKDSFVKTLNPSIQI